MTNSFIICLFQAKHMPINLVIVGLKNSRSWIQFIFAWMEELHPWIEPLLPWMGGHFPWIERYFPWIALIFGYESKAGLTGTYHS